MCSKEKAEHEAAEQEGGHRTPSRCLHRGATWVQLYPSYNCFVGYTGFWYVLWLLQDMGTKSASEPFGMHKDDIPRLLAPLCSESKAMTADETWEEREATLNTEAKKPKTAPKAFSRFRPRTVMNSENQWFVEIPLVCISISHSEGRHSFSDTFYTTIIPNFKCHLFRFLLQNKRRQLTQERENATTKNLLQAFSLSTPGRNAPTPKTQSATFA